MMAMIMRYAVVIERASDGGYSAYVPDLPGCVAPAETLEETRRLIHEAVEFHLETMRADGDPIPEPSTICEYVEAAGGVDAA
jgi:predicted RNase H-like HicB family nuclease